MIFGELPRLRLTNLDVTHDVPIAAVVQELLLDGDEDQIALHGDKRFVRRLVFDPPAPRSTALKVQRPGLLDSLADVPRPRTAPGPHEIEIEVTHAGLNFRDVLTALGMIPPRGDALGCECVGRVAQIGDAVDNVRVGDPVMAIAAGGLASHVVTDAARAIAIPPALAPEDAATLPIVFLTALYGLQRLADLKPNQRVLIHSAAGGVGMAAVQIAQRVGAEIFATASPAKWDRLRELGVKHVMNSRTADFAAQIRELTGGEGVDVVLNALTGEMLRAGLDLVRPGGVFLEMGKTELFDPQEIEQRGIAYRPFDLLDAAPNEQQQMLRELVAGLESSAYRPLPTTVYPVAAAGEAFRFMSRGQHVGKIVLQRDAAALRPRRHVSRHRRSRGPRGSSPPGGSSTGGAGRVVLASRRSADATTQDRIDALQANVEVVPTDVTDEASLRACLAHCNAGDRPLRGIVHAAGVVDDAALGNLDWPRIDSVLAPKTRGAWLLHRLTEEQPLDFLLLYSSISALVGGRGQSSYAAANAFLDALATHRRHRGLPATSVQWGPWSDVGMAAALDERQRQRIVDRGVELLDTAQATALLPALLRSPAPVVAAARFDTDRMLAHHRDRVPSLLRDTTVTAREPSTPEPPPPAEQRPPLVARLQLSAESERLELCVEAVQALCTRIMEGETIDPDAPLMDAGDRLADGSRAAQRPGRADRAVAARVAAVRPSDRNGGGRTPRRRPGRRVRPRPCTDATRGPCPRARSDPRQPPRRGRGGPAHRADRGVPGRDP